MRLLLLFLSLWSLGWGADIAKGKSLLLTFSAPMGYLAAAERNVSVILHPSDRTKGIAILPIDYDAAPGESNLTWVTPAGDVPVTFTVIEGSYPSETLSVDPAKVTPPPEAQEQIAREKAEAEAIYGRFTPIRYWNRPFIAPLETFITSAYGSARIYNGSLKSYHGGVDFRAKTPTPVLASNDGVVILAKERYYSGGTIILDHGEGIYTCYFHLSRFDVAQGEIVKRAQPIALSGASGRITGPHLHFGMIVHGLQTDPLDLIAQIARLFESPSAASDIQTVTSPSTRL